MTKANSKTNENYAMILDELRNKSVRWLREKFFEYDYGFKVFFDKNEFSVKALLDKKSRDSLILDILRTLDGFGIDIESVIFNHDQNLPPKNIVLICSSESEGFELSSFGFSVGKKTIELIEIKGDKIIELSENWENETRDAGFVILKLTDSDPKLKDALIKVISFLRLRSAERKFCLVVGDSQNDIALSKYAKEIGVDSMIWTEDSTWKENLVSIMRKARYNAHYCKPSIQSYNKFANSLIFLLKRSCDSNLKEWEKLRHDDDLKGIVEGWQEVLAGLVQDILHLEETWKGNTDIADDFEGKLKSDPEYIRIKKVFEESEAETRTGGHTR